MLDTDFELGMRVRDTISGFTGIVTIMGDHISGCTRIAVAPEDVDKTRKGEEEFFYPDQLEIIDKETDYTEVNSITDCSFELGQEVRDQLTDFAGVASVINYQLYNCPQICVQSTSDADESHWYDDVRLEAIEDTPTHDFEDLEERMMSTETGAVSEERAPQNLRK